MLKIPCSVLCAWLCPCAGGAGAGSLSYCGSEVWYMDTAGNWVLATGMAGIKVGHTLALLQRVVA